MFRLALIVFLCASGVCRAQPNSLASCLGGLAGNPRFAPIAGKVALGQDATASAAMLADASLAGERERPVIGDWVAARSDCLKAAGAEGNADYRPPLLVYRIDAENRLIAAAAELHDRKIAFGEFNRRRQAIADELDGKTTALSRRIQEQRTTEEQAGRQSRETEKLQKELQDAERRASAAEQKARDAANRKAETIAPKPLTPPPPPLPPLRPYRDCYPFGGRLVCTLR